MAKEVVQNAPLVTTQMMTIRRAKLAHMGNI